MRRGSGSSARTASHGSVSREPLEPAGAVLDEEVGERRVVGAVATVAGGLDGALGREEAADRLHVVAQVHDAHRQRDRLAARVRGEALAVPALEREGAAPRGRSGRSRAARTSMSATSHPDAKLCTAHSWAVSWSIWTICLALLLGAPRGRELDDVAHHLGGVAGVVDERLGADRDLVAEQRGDLVRVAGAADVAQQRDPVGGRRARRRRTPPPRRSTSRAGTSAAATRAAGRRRCPARAPAWRRTRRGEVTEPR